MKKVFLFIILLFSSIHTFGQEIPMYSQVFLNPFVYNPAHLDPEGRPTFAVLRSSQWNKIEGAPKTLGFNFHTLIKDKINFGLSFYNDERAILNSTSAMLTIGYRAKFEDYHYLSFSVSGGVGFNTFDMSLFDPNDPDLANDPLLKDLLKNNIVLNGNAGITYHNKGFNLGVSLPKIFKSKYGNTENFNTGELSPLTDIIFMTNYKWEISENKFAFEPSVYYFYEEGADGIFEVSGIFHFLDAIWLGADFRQNFGVAGMLGLNINNNLKFGYSYHFLSEQNNNILTGSQEIQLVLSLGEKKVRGKISAIEKRRNMLRTMGKLPSQQEPQKAAPPIKVTNDPFVSQQTDPEEYDEEAAMRDLLGEGNQTNTQAESVTPKAKELNEEQELLQQMEDEDVEEITFEEKIELIKEPPKRVNQEQPLAEPAVASSEEYLEPTLDDEGFYTGPTTVLKGNHLLELDKGNYVVVGTFDNYRNAEEYSDKLFMGGFYTKFGYISQTKIYYVYIFESDDFDETRDTGERFREIGANFRENWVLTVN